MTYVMHRTKHSKKKMKKWRHNVTPKLRIKDLNLQRKKTALYKMTIVKSTKKEKNTQIFCSANDNKTQKPVSGPVSDLALLP